MTYSYQPLSLAEELLLFALDDDKGTTPSTVSVDPGLSGAILLDLLADGSLVEAGDRLAVADGAAPEDPLGAEALSAIRAKGEPEKPKHWVDRLPKELKPIKGRVADRLVERGVLSEERHKRLGLIPSTRYPEADPAPERAVRERLGAVLLQGTEPDAHTARLVVLLHALDLVKAVVPKEDRKAAKARAKAIAESDAVGRAVKRAVDQVAAAAAVAAMSGAGVASASS